MTALTELSKKTSGGIFHLVCFDADGQNRLASGTAFWCQGKLVTNHHVMNVGLNRQIWIRRESDLNTSCGLILKSQEWFGRIVTSSDEHSHDYAVMDVPEIASWPDLYSFTLSQKSNVDIGTSVAFMGYPLEHNNLTLHSGHVSSVWKQKHTWKIQVDASVNGGNSGGPLIDLEDGNIIGIITRKATGLSGNFNALRRHLRTNIEILQAQPEGGIFIAGIDPKAAILNSHQQLLGLTDELERQANVGIGYAFSSRHLIESGAF